MLLPCDNLEPSLPPLAVQDARDSALYGRVVTEKGGPATWMWIIGPLALYILERLYRFYKSMTRRLQISKVRQHGETKGLSAAFDY